MTSAGPKRAPALRVWAPWLIAAAMVLAMPRLFGSGFAISLLCRMAIAAVFALSFNMLMGQGGMMDFGHAVYLGLGGFLAMHAMRAANAGLWLPTPALPLVGAAGGLAAAALGGLIVARSTRTAFAMITLGLAEAIVALVLMLPRLFGGEEGINADRSEGPPLFGYDFGSPIQAYYVVAVWALLAALLMYRFTLTPLGRLANAVRDNAERVGFLGYNPARVRYLTYLLSGLFAGLAGGMQAINDEIMTSANIGSNAAGAVLLMTFIGGVGTFWGPVLGAVVVTLMQMALGTVTDAWQLYNGLLFVAMVLWAPGGLSGIILAHAPLLRTGRARRLVPSYVRVLPGFVCAFAGTVGLAELAYRLQSIRGGGPPGGHVLFLPADPQTALPWVVSLVLAGAGLWLLARTAPAAHSAWLEAAADANA
jgi:branched-chain amino acid transport system permease protein